MGATERSKIEESHAPMFATIFSDSHQAYTDIKVRFIRADVAARDMCWKISGAFDAHGIPRSDRRGLLNFVMSKDASQWQIIVIRNLNWTALPPASKWWGPVEVGAPATWTCLRIIGN